MYGRADDTTCAFPGSEQENKIISRGASSCCSSFAAVVRSGRVIKGAFPCCSFCAVVVRSGYVEDKGPSLVASFSTAVVRGGYVEL